MPCIILRIESLKSLDLRDLHPLISMNLLLWFSCVPPIDSEVNTTDFYGPDVQVNILKMISIGFSSHYIVKGMGFNRARLYILILSLKQLCWDHLLLDLTCNEMHEHLIAWRPHKISRRTLKVIHNLCGWHPYKFSLRYFGRSGKEEGCVIVASPHCSFVKLNLLFYPRV